MKYIITARKLYSKLKAHVVETAGTVSNEE